MIKKDKKPHQKNDHCCIMSPDLWLAVVFKNKYHEVPQYRHRISISNDHLVTIIASLHPVVVDRYQVSVAGLGTSQLIVMVVLRCRIRQRRHFIVRMVLVDETPDTLSSAMRLTSSTYRDLILNDHLSMLTCKQAESHQYAGIGKDIQS